METAAILFVRTTTILMNVIAVVLFYKLSTKSNYFLDETEQDVLVVGGAKR